MSLPNRSTNGAAPIGGQNVTNEARQASETAAKVLQAGIRRRVSHAWREIRRGASTSKVRGLFYGSEEDSLDIALADALALICQQGPIRMGELAEAMHITPASTTRAVSCLVDKGLVERVRSPQDQRSIEVVATMAGREHYGEISSRIQRGVTQILGEFTPAEQLQLAEYLERFTKAVDRLADQGLREEREPQGTF